MPGGGDCMCVCVSCSVVSNSLRVQLFVNCSLPGSSVHGDSPNKNTEVGSHSLLQGIFPIQGSNPGLLHCRQSLYHLNRQGIPMSKAAENNNLQIFVWTCVFTDYWLLQYLARSETGKLFSKMSVPFSFPLII